VIGNGICQGCLAPDCRALVMDGYSDQTYALCAACLSKCLPTREEMLRRIESPIFRRAEPFR
jgi:hypothetical protein